MAYVFENNSRFLIEDDTDRFVFEEEPKVSKASKESATILARAKNIGKSDITDNVLQQEIDTVSQIAKGYPVLETAAHLATMTYGLPASGIAALAAGFTTKTKLFDKDVALKALEKTSNLLIYQPKTEEGKKLTRTAMYPIEKLEQGAEYTGEKTLEKTGSPVLATAVYTGIMAIPMAIPLLRKTLKKTKSPTKVKPSGQAATEFLQKEFKERFIIEETKDVVKKPFQDIAEQTKELPIEKEGFREIPIKEVIQDTKTIKGEAFDLMQDQVNSTRTRGVTQEISGMQSETIGFPADSPQWMRDLPNYINSKGKKRGYSRKQLNAVFDNIKSGKKLTEGQTELKGHLEKASGKVIAEDLRSSFESVELEAAGFEPMGGVDVTVAELQKGDKFVGVVDGKKDTWTVMGDNKKGDVVLQDGVQKTIDIFDEVTIEGLKKTTKESESSFGMDPVGKIKKPPTEMPVDLDFGKSFRGTPDGQKEMFRTEAGVPSQKLYSGLPIPEITNVYKKATDKIWDVGVQQKIPQLLEKIPGGKAVNRALLYDYRGDLKNTGKYIKSMEDKTRAQQIGKTYALDLGTRLQRMPEKAQLQLGEYIRGELETLPKELIKLGDEAKLSMLDLGKQAVDMGLLNEKVFFENAGRYMPRLYTAKEYSGLLSDFKLTKPNRLDLSRFQKRKDIPKEIREEMGEILTPGYPIAKGITQLTHDIEQARWFKGIADNKDWSLTKGSETPIPDGWKKLPDNKKLGDLSEANVHPEVFGDITEAIRIMETPEKVWRKALGAWKFGKVILSPKTHARNVMSNSILAHLGGMPMYEQPIYLTKSIKAMRGKDNYWQAATKEGLLGTTWTEHELSALFSGVEGNLKGLKAGSLPEKFGIVGSGFEKAKGSMNKAAKLYQAEEEWFKLAKYIHNIEKKGMKPTAAAKDAEKWLFNYGKVTKFQEGYRSKWYGAPFATFTAKALPRIAEAAIKTPHRFILPGAMIYGLEKAAMNMIGDSPEQFKAKKELLPDWMKGNFLGIPNFARVPILDESGREYYLNLTYILPWGDIGESGSFAGIPGSLIPMSQPFVKESWQQIANYDSFWDKPIVAKEDLVGKSLTGKIKTQAENRAQHLLQTMAPTPVLDIQKGAASLKGKPDYRGRERPSGAVVADAVFGIKLYPVDYIEQMVRKINELHPQKGFIAKKIKGQIKTLEVKRKAMEKKGKPTEFYRKAIESKINQLKGMGAELSKIGEAYKKTKNDNRWVIE